MKGSRGRASLAWMAAAAAVAVTAGLVVAGVGLNVIPGATGVSIASSGGASEGSGGTRTVPESRLEPRPVTRPVEAVPPREPAGLLPELSRLVDREGTVVRKAVGPDNVQRTCFRAADEKLELVLLENRYLETLENLTDYGKKAVHVRVSGTVYVYRGQNYLLLTLVQVKS
jgi:hypothetical protein